MCFWGEHEGYFAWKEWNDGGDHKKECYDQSLNLCPAQSDLILALISLILLVEKNCHGEKFQLSMYDNCGEIENFSTCEEISDVST